MANEKRRLWLYVASPYSAETEERVYVSHWFVSVMLGMVVVPVEAILASHGHDAPIDKQVAPFCGATVM